MKPDCLSISHEVPFAFEKQENNLASHLEKKTANAYLDSSFAFQPKLPSRFNALDEVSLSGTGPCQQITNNILAEMPNDGRFNNNQNGQSGRTCELNQEDSGCLSDGWNVLQQDTDEEMGDDDDSDEIEGEVNRTMIKSFKEHAERGTTMLPFTKNVINAINLMCTLRHTKASMGTHEKIMEWHFQAKGETKGGQRHTDHRDHITRQKVIKHLKARHIPDESKWLNETHIVLPHCKPKVNIIWNGAEAAITSLLTGPRIAKED